MKSPILTKYSIDGNYNKAFAQIQELTKDNGRYYVGFDGEYCHGLNVYRRNGKFYVYDQQQNLSRNLLELLKKSKATSFEVLRIDNLLLDKTNIDHWIVSL